MSGRTVVVEVDSDVKSVAVVRAIGVEVAIGDGFVAEMSVDIGIGGSLTLRRTFALTRPRGIPSQLRAKQTDIRPIHTHIVTITFGGESRVVGNETKEENTQEFNFYCTVSLLL